MAEARTGAGRPPRELPGEEGVIRPSRIQNEQPEGISPEGGSVRQSVNDSWNLKPLGVGGTGHL